MILYYTGTGNSEYVAKKIAHQIQDEVINLFDKIKTHDYSTFHSESPFVFVYPTYAWRMPRLLVDYIKKTEFTGTKNAYFVATCGDSTGNMVKYLRELCVDKAFDFMGCAQIIMPENYIAMFDAPEEQEAKEIIQKADVTISNTADIIKNNGFIPEYKIRIGAKLSSGIINRAFYSMVISAKKFYATEECIHCGKCALVCPLNNVTIKEGKPAWGNQCTHCMACICKCPNNAIEYGNKTKGKPRYQCLLEEETK